MLRQTVIQGLWEQRGQDLLRDHEIARERYVIPEIGYTIDQTISALNAWIREIDTQHSPLGNGMPYDALTAQIRRFESVAKPFLREMARIYERCYGRNPTELPPYSAQNLPPYGS